MHNIKLTIAYDGTDYKGWQKTTTGDSIEETLQKFLEQILQQSVTLQAASRTDAGVHAVGQVVNFISIRPIDINKLVHSVNCLLPKDIVVLLAEETTPSFHPTLDCQSKEYRYYICYGKTQFPHHRLYSWHYPYPSLKLDLMNEAIGSFVGKHDFKTFCNTQKNANYKDFERELLKMEIQEIETDRVFISVRGTHFLYKMVRNIVGTLVYIGSGKMQLREIPGLLVGKNRSFAGVTAPAHGLFLQHIFY